MSRMRFAKTAAYSYLFRFLPLYFGLYDSNVAGVFVTNNNTPLTSMISSDGWSGYFFSPGEPSVCYLMKIKKNSARLYPKT